MTKFTVFGKLLLMEIFYSVDLLFYSQLILIYIMINLYRHNARNEQNSKIST